MNLFFKYSPKRHGLLATVIQNVSPKIRQTTLINLCRTCERLGLRMRETGSENVVTMLRAAISIGQQV